MSPTTSIRSARAKSRRRLGRLTVALAVVASTFVVIVPGAVAGGRHRVVVAGTYTVADLGTTDCTTLDETRLRCRTTGLKSDYAGDLVGQTTADFRQTIDCAGGRTRGHGVETFSGSLLGGAAGTLTWRLHFTADFDCATFVPSNLRILGVLKRGTGGLAGLRGLLLFDDTSYHGLLR